MEDSNKNFLDSLDLNDKEMEKYIPFVLQDLWDLGSIPEYVYHLIDGNADKDKIKTIIDFGCGKGAVLIYLAKRMDFHGTGIDIVSEFIESAKQYAIENSVEKRLHFVEGDLLKYINNKEKFDIVIYGYDSGILGDVYESVLRLQNVINDSGYLIIEIAFTAENMARIEGLTTENELMQQYKKTDLEVIDKIFWDIEKIKSINSRNNRFINKRIEELKIKYPTKSKIFERYMNDQLEECKLLEKDIICSTWILRKLP